MLRNCVEENVTADEEEVEGVTGWFLAFEVKFVDGWSISRKVEALEEQVDAGDCEGRW